MIDHSHHPRGASPVAAAHREPRVVTEYVMPARFRGMLQLANCASPLGPVISLEASLVLSGLQARVTFRDRPRRDDVAVQEASVMVPLVLPGERLERPLQTMRGAPARPRLTVGLFDRDQRPLADAQEFGECTDGSRLLELPIRVDVGAIVWLSARASSGSSGAKLLVNGKLVFSRGVTAQLGLGPAADSTRLDRVATEVPLVNPGTMFFFYERIVENRLRGDPWVSMRFLDERGRPIGEEQPIGLLSAA